MIFVIHISCKVLYSKFTGSLCTDISFAPLSLLFLEIQIKLQILEFLRNLEPNLCHDEFTPLSRPFVSAETNYGAFASRFFCSPLSPNDFQLEIYVLVYVKIVLKVFSFFRKKFVIRVSAFESFEKFFRVYLFQLLWIVIFFLLLKLKRIILF